jgi:hypothetical protein
MKLGLFFCVLVAFGALFAGYAPYHPATAKTVAKPAATLPGSRAGSVGGPATKARGDQRIGQQAGGDQWNVSDALPPLGTCQRFRGPVEAPSSTASVRRCAFEASR